MKITRRLVLIWLMLCLGAGMVAGQGLSGYYLMGENSNQSFTNVPTLESVLGPLRGTPSSPGVIGSIRTLVLESGSVTGEDWYYLRMSSGNDMGLRRLSVFQASNAQLAIEDMVDYDDARTMTSSLTRFEVPTLRRLSCSVFHRSNLTTISLEGLEEVGHGAFAYSNMLKSVELPKVTKLEAQAFQSCQQLRTLKTPRLRGLVNKDENRELPVRPNSTATRKRTFAGGKTFAGCSQFSEWHLGENFDPRDVLPNHFEGLPEGRYIIFVDENGKWLSGTQLAQTISRFMASSGWDASTKKWHGWYLSSTDLHEIIYHKDNESFAGVFTLPINRAKAGERVRVIPEHGGTNGSAKIEVIKIEYEDGTVKTVDHILDPTFIMPDQNVKITVNVLNGWIKAHLFYTVDGKDYDRVIEDASLWGVYKQLEAQHTGADRHKVWRLEILSGDMTEWAWHYVGQFSKLREFELKPGVAYVTQPMERLLNGNYNSLFAHTIESMLIPKLYRVPRFFLRDRPWVNRIMLPHVDEFAAQSFSRTPDPRSGEGNYSKSVVMGVPGAKLPSKVSHESFQEMFVSGAFPHNQVLGDRYLLFLDANGKELQGAARDAAYTLYKGDARDGNPNDELWFGWHLRHLRVHLAATSLANGSVTLLSPVEGVGKQGDDVQFRVVANPGFGVSKVEYQEQGSSERKLLEPDSNGQYNTKLPGVDITIYVTYEGRTYGVVVQEGIQKGSLAASPTDNVQVGSTVEVTSSAEAGYEVDADELYYQRWANGVAHEPKVPITLTDGRYTFEMPDYTVKVFGKFKPKHYNLTVCENVVGGKITILNPTTSAPAGKAATDDVIYVIAEPLANYLTEEVVWTREDSAEQAVLNNTIVMPPANVEVCAKFKALNEGPTGKYAIITSPRPVQGGGITANPKVDIAPGTESKLTVQASCGYRFVEGSLEYCKYGEESESNPSNWTKIALDNGEYKLQMPDYTVKVRATFEPEKQTVKLPFNGTGVDPVSKSRVSIKSPATVEEYKTGSEIVVQVNVGNGWGLVSLRWREDDGVDEWKELDLNNPRFVMPCKAVAIDASFERRGFAVTAISMEGGVLLASPNSEVAPGTEVIVDILLEDGFAFVFDVNDPEKRNVWWSPVNAADPEVRAGLVEGENKFRVGYKYGQFSFEMPDESVVTLGGVWVWADVTNKGNRVGFVPIEKLDGKPRGMLTANRYSSVPVNYLVRVSYLRDLQNSAWALDETTVEYIEAELVDGELIAKEDAVWKRASGASFQMPNTHVLVRGSIYPTGNSIFMHPDRRHGRIEATPWANVPLDADVKLVAIPDEGYRMDGNFRYTEVGQDLWRTLSVNGDAHDSFRMPGHSVYVDCYFVPLEYTVTPEESEGGRLLPLPLRASVGTPILVDYTRTPGWEIVPGSIEWAREGTEEWVKAEEGRFTMPASDVKVRAQFQRIGSEEFEVILVVDGQGVLEAYDADFQILSKMKVASGTELRIVRTPDEGWQSAELYINESIWSEETYKVEAPTVIKATFIEAAVTSVDEERLAQVYPNPFDGTLHVVASGAKDIELYTSSGLRVHREAYRDGVLSLDKLPSGVYMLRVRFSDGSEAVRRVVKR